MNETERLLNDAVMGDSSAIRQVAERLDGASATALGDAVAERVRFRAAADDFQKKYRDVWEDPQLRRLALSRDTELANSQPELDYAVRLELVGQELRDWSRKLATGSKPAAKANKMPVARDPAQRRPATSVEWDISDGNAEDEDAESVIDQMARARGQDHAIRHRWGKHHLPNADE